MRYVLTSRKYPARYSIFPKTCPIDDATEFVNPRYNPDKKIITVLKTASNIIIISLPARKSPLLKPLMMLALMVKK